MRRLVELSIFALLIVALAGCTIYTGPGVRIRGSGRVIQETREVSGFTGVTVNGAAVLNIDRTGTESLVVTADDNLMPYLVTEVRGSTLYIEPKPGYTIVAPITLKLALTVKDLESLTLNGATTTAVKGLDAERLQVAINGASTVKMAGQANRQDIVLSGAATYNAENLDSQSASVTNNGAGAAVVRVSQQLNAEINGLGSIEYIGNPQVSKAVHGIGSIRPR